MERLLKPDEQNPGFWMTKRYIFALMAIAILAASAFGTVGLLIAEHKSTLSVVNISGRQRMLSQRTALFVAQLAAADSYSKQQKFRKELRHSTILLQQAHLALTGRANAINMSIDMSPEARKRYFKGAYPLNAQMRGYIEVLREIIDMPSDELSPEHPSVKFVLEVAPGKLVEALDSMVKFYQEEGEKAFDFLRWLEAVFLSLTILVLTVEAFFIFRPMVRHVSLQMMRIKDFSDGLEETVTQRTQQLEEAKTAAVKANAAKSKFLAAAGHDLKQPLEAIGMFSGMLERRMPDDRSAAIMRDMHDAQRSMRSLLDSILSLSKLEAGVIEPNPSHFELQPLLTQLTREYRVSAHAKGLGLRMVPSSLKLHTDPLLLERILRNFLSNAIRYTKEGRILLGCRRVDDHISIEVWDSGPGIPAEGMDKIFTEFSQLDDPERDRSEGIGLGLAIVKRLADLLELEISCESEVGKGSKFAILLPLKETD
ncbi:Signal transduction histidine kinase [Candidatus Terasakiella magnetica]|uniref:histidine kinase n=1 Tax=Candidatus Terasakiella magnetica TaxID=1867952 RepID=A0A1C3RJ56_9PROT|nr:ATP-binding protein [Candidatus Terasakiella magnetica]SCA57284.1 Signal transduction histidine kinase [Candidatus Terasakiella magnetica]